VYDPADDETAIVVDYPFVASGNTITGTLSLSDLGIALGQTIAVSAFQEGASNGWQVDWVESAAMTLSAGSNQGFEIESQFNGNGYGFTLILTDEGEAVVDPNSFTAEQGGNPVMLSASKVDGVTTIEGRFSALLPVDTVQAVNISGKVGGQSQSQDFAINVSKYSVLPAASRGAMDPNGDAGFMATFTMISSWQPMETPSVHGDIAELAEQQLAGELKDEGGFVYYNEATTNYNEWESEEVSLDGVINWYALADQGDAVLNFPQDQLFPVLSDIGAPQLEGVVIELETYLDLSAGYHQFGLFSEGGHKVSAGHQTDGPILSLFDNSDGSERVPTYYARGQVFDIVAPKDGLYPVRILWFQSSPGQEQGLMLEFYSIKDRQLHLVNDASNPSAIGAYRSALPVADVTPEISLIQSDGNLIIQWVGTLQLADDPRGPWVRMADDSASPLIWDTSKAPIGFARAVAE
jgi:hypothetical protein